jgi:hypothetical protein
MTLQWLFGMALAVVSWLLLRDEPQPQPVTPRRFSGGAIG